MTLLDAIASEFLDEHDWPRKTPLPREQVRQWIESDDLEVLAAARHLLERKGGFARVEPPLTSQEKRLFLSAYFERVLSENEHDEEHQGQGSQWIDSGFDLSHGLVYWIADFLRDEETPLHEREALLAWLRDVLLHHPRAHLITTAVLDHLLWNRATRRYFKSWHTDPELAFLFER